MMPLIVATVCGAVTVIFSLPLPSNDMKPLKVSAFIPPIVKSPLAFTEFPMENVPVERMDVLAPSVSVPVPNGPETRELEELAPMIMPPEFTVTPAREGALTAKWKHTASCHDQAIKPFTLVMMALIFSVGALGETF